METTKATETKTPRTMDEIRAEYNNVATHVGGLTYQAEAIKSQLNSFYQKMSALNDEATERNKFDQAEKTNVSAV